mmetsp:Transcript_973/g.1577  ORF Transcript_973/g.1577 Transcript_973/m.1577 type:complete len:463 (-) Transcript_973:605-1993(-)
MEQQDRTIIKTRLKRGQCPTCGNQLLTQSSGRHVGISGYRTGFFKKSWQPIETQFASNGICLLCNYAAAAAVANSRCVAGSGGNGNGFISIGEVFVSHQVSLASQAETVSFSDCEGLTANTANGGMGLDVSAATTTAMIEDGSISTATACCIPTAEVVTVMPNHSTSSSSSNGHHRHNSTSSLPNPRTASVGSSSSFHSSPEPLRERTYSGTTSMVTMSTNSSFSSTRRNNMQIRDGNNAIVGTYDGDVNSDEERDGHGTMKWTNGHEYDGSWVRNKRQGRGTYCWSNGDVYAGCWVSGLREGLGTCRYSDGGAIYTGEWKNDKMHGRGSYVWPDGQEYVGGFVNGLMEGHGHCRYSNGVEYSGEYVGGKKHGWGRHQCANGAEYIGHYKNDEKDGPGTFRHANGEVDIDVWREGTRVGGGVRWNATQSRAYKLEKGKQEERITLSEARMIAATLCVPVPFQ